MTAHPAFNTRPHYTMLVPLPQLRALASNERRRGHYNLSTLWYFRKCWSLSGQASDYVNYLSFRRDLGYPVNHHQQQKLKCLFHGKMHYFCWAMLHRKSASLYRRLLKSGQVNNESASLAIQAPLQQAKSIQLVGNSGSLKQSQLGTTIDSAEIVVRFNRCFSDETTVRDTGEKTDIWVGAPDVKHPAPLAKWYIIAGPAMLNWLPRRPQAFTSLEPLFNVPLASWRELVRQLAAPPSAGLLTLYWFMQLAPQTPKRICGYSVGKQAIQYHHADRLHQAVSRHNWEQEQCLLNTWLQKKLVLPC